MAFAIRRPATAFSLDKSGKDTSSFKDERHLAFIRTLPSAISGKAPCEACHIRTGSAEHNKKKTGKGQKPSDAWTVPLTAEEHRDQHAGSEMAFWNRHSINPFSLARDLYAASGDRGAAVRILNEYRDRKAGLASPGALWQPIGGRDGD